MGITFHRFITQEKSFKLFVAYDRDDEIQSKKHSSNNSVGDGSWLFGLKTINL